MERGDMNAMNHREQRIFRADGRTLIVAMDHSAVEELPGLEDPVGIIERTVPEGADAFLLPFGSARLAEEAVGARGLILTVNSRDDYEEVAVEEALRLGADAVKFFIMPDLADGGAVRNRMFRFGAVCARWRLPFLVEIVPSQPYPADVLGKKLAAWSRVAVEAGATFLKVPYTGDASSFHYLVDAAHVPVVILGGDPKRGLEAVLGELAEAIRAGAAGAALGRVVWSSPDGREVVRAASGIIHGTA